MADDDLVLHRNPSSDQIQAAINELASDIAAQSATNAVVANVAETVTVGAGGDFSTISAAIASLSRKHAAFVNGGFVATISLLSGFTLTEQLVFQGVDLGWITITSVDAEVPVPSENIPSGQGAFYAVGLATIPKIGCFFRYVTDNDGRATPALRGFDILHGSTIQFTVQTAGFGDDVGAKKCNRLLQVAHGSICIATSGLSLKDGNDIGLRASNASLVSCPNAIITGCTNNGIAASGAIVQAANAVITGSLGPVAATPTATVEVATATLTSTGTYAISAEGGTVYASGAICTGGVNAAEDGFIDARNVAFNVGSPIRVAQQGTVDMTGSTNGVPTITVNQYRRDGLIYDNNVPEAGVIASFLTAALGSAAAPTINFLGRLTDGLFSKGAGLIGFATAGIERAYIDASGLTATALRALNGTGVGAVIIAGRTTDGRAELAFQTNAFSANNARLVATTNQLSTEAGGVEVQRHVADAATVDTETSILLRRNVGGTFSVVRVSMGAADSAGAGFKTLRVPN